MPPPLPGSQGQKTAVLNNDNIPEPPKNLPVLPPLPDFVLKAPLKLFFEKAMLR